MPSTINNFDLEYYTSAIAAQVKALVSSAEVDLTLDTIPTQGSSNYLNSGAIYNALNGVTPSGGGLTENEINSIVQQTIAQINNESGTSGSSAINGYALTSDLTNHVESKVTDTNGTHGIRYNNDKLQVNTSTSSTPSWNDVSISDALLSDSNDEYSSSKAYAVGDIVIYNNTLYKCTTACSAAAWSTNSGYFTATTIAAVLSKIPIFSLSGTTLTITTK